MESLRIGRVQNKKKNFPLFSPRIKDSSANTFLIIQTFLTKLILCVAILQSSIQLRGYFNDAYLTCLYKR